jgi:hypothetical protein
MLNVLRNLARQLCNLRLHQRDLQPPIRRQNQCRLFFFGSSASIDALFGEQFSPRYFRQFASGTYSEFEFISTKKEKKKTSFFRTKTQISLLPLPETLKVAIHELSKKKKNKQLTLQLCPNLPVAHAFGFSPIFYNSFVDSENVLRENVILTEEISSTSIPGNPFTREYIKIATPNVVNFAR